MIAKWEAPCLALRAAQITVQITAPEPCPPSPKSQHRPNHSQSTADLLVIWPCGRPKSQPPSRVRGVRNRRTAHENHRTTTGKAQNNHRKIIGYSQENHRIIAGKSQANRTVFPSASSRSQKYHTNPHRPNHSQNHRNNYRSLSNVSMPRQVINLNPCRCLTEVMIGTRKGNPILEPSSTP